MGEGEGRWEKERGGGRRRGEVGEGDPSCCIVSGLLPERPIFQTGQRNSLNQSLIGK